MQVSLDLASNRPPALHSLLTFSPSPGRCHRVSPLQCRTLLCWPGCWNDCMHRATLSVRVSLCSEVLRDCSVAHRQAHWAWSFWSFFHSFEGVRWVLTLVLFESVSAKGCVNVSDETSWLCFFHYSLLGLSCLSIFHFKAKMDSWCLCHWLPMEHHRGYGLQRKKLSQEGRRHSSPHLSFCLSIFILSSSSSQIGLLLAAVVDERYKDVDDSRSYRVPIGIQFALAIVISVGVFIIPESPRWLIKKQQVEKAALALARLNHTSPDSALVVAEIADIQANLDLELTLGNGTYLDCFKSNERKNLQRTVSGMILQAFTQLSGINFIFYYGTIFFQVSSLVNTVVNFPTWLSSISIQIPVYLNRECLRFHYHIKCCKRRHNR